ncbi:fumarate reductase/succinate dehydrogenase flavoprotein domain protein [Pseudopedobacter saltans DSM 12145]|uniref:Fumarate reductase/succinate dehydrogenase flavoprotein domain protein n=1 Tax=Pseudopedobacter saltans (strain ATCC 51119 / DSM 12145 / JCM 21818 / CCUG 39354 / LMG 10337 / NBRC 100064 / NCIMB 13643) TaxID=762903 RepID=F0SDP3_PSESL|nr:YpdA family putative bacillithiol disulfide reductase [Pseudopedobacter saltans]ADY50770.1 fumarate reductase/succinate dehydrogenase flavoprotein domain protein [Pseudopedobacter saltans DSM 12145]
MDYDILIIGAGPIGLACGIEAKKKGLSYIIIEKGCLVNSLYNYPQNMTFFSTSERLEIGDIPFISNNLKPTRSEALEYYRRVTLYFDLNVRLFEEVLDLKGVQGSFEVKTSKNFYKAKNIIVSTGFYDIPNWMGVEGENLSKVFHYYNDPSYFAIQKVMVVGASNSSVDAALECYRKGAEVTMVIRNGEISDRVKYWVKPDIENRIKEGSIKAYFNSEIKSIKEDVVLINTPNGDLQLDNDFVLALTGYQPNFSFLQHLGIMLEGRNRYPKYDEASMETNRKGVYLAGVVCGGMDTHLWFIENSRIHAEIIISHIVSE